jgi:Tfp pilus assembly protein PilN
MPSINLAPGTQYIITARKRRIRLYGIAIAIFTIFALGWLGLYTYVAILTKSSEDVKAKITVVDQKIQALNEEAKRVAFFEKRLVDVSQILNNHIGWEKVFGDVERLLPPDTVLTAFDATNGSSTITVQGTTQNVDQIAVALASLTQDVGHPSIFASGSVKTIQREERKEGDIASVIYKFTMTLEFDSSALSKTAL